MTIPSTTSVSFPLKPFEDEALRRLIAIALRDSGQSGRVASFLLAWWNARVLGGFDLTDIWAVDAEIQKDMITVLAYLARAQHYPDTLGFGPAFKCIVKLWRNLE